MNRRKMWDAWRRAEHAPECYAKPAPGQWKAPCARHCPKRMAREWLERDGLRTDEPRRKAAR